MGLARTGALLATTLSLAIAARQRDSYKRLNRSPCQDLMAGHAMARNAELTARAPAMRSDTLDRKRRRSTATNSSEDVPPKPNNATHVHNST